MKTIVRSGVALLAVLVVAAQPVAAQALRTVTSSMEATATWQSCDASGCFETSAFLTDESIVPPGGTPILIQQGCIQRQPAALPEPPTIFHILTACVSDPTFSPDLTAASATGETLLFQADCIVGEGCFPGSVVPVQDVTITLSWSASGERTRVHEVTVEEDGSGCQVTTITVGWERPAEATVSGFPFDLGTPTGATIREVTERRIQVCPGE
jgi:hypothetical protein